MEHLVSKYLTDLNISISQKYCKKLILSHPDYPSLLSIADALKRLGVPYQVGRVKKEHLANLEYPYLLWPNEYGREPKIIRGKRDLSTNGINAPSDSSTQEQAVVLKAEPTARITDEENNRQRSEDHFLGVLKGVLISAVAGLILLAAIPFFSWIYALLLLTVFAGAIVAYLLVAKDLGISYQPVEDFCRAGEKSNCDAILKSRGAGLFAGKVTFSDGAAIYFLSQLIILGFLFPTAGGTSFWGGSEWVERMHDSLGWIFALAPSG